LVAEQNHCGQWGFSSLTDNQFTTLTRKQRRELHHRLQRRVRRLQDRLYLDQHQRIIESAVKNNWDINYLDDAINAIKTQNQLKDTINKYLTLIHYIRHTDDVSYKGNVIARRVDNGRENYFWDGPRGLCLGMPIDIGTLALCSNITDSEEILNVVTILWQYITGNDAYTVGELATYQRNHILVDIARTDYDWEAQFQCKPDCQCSMCYDERNFYRCWGCGGDGCPECD
jgi:hypothetical protein